MSGKQLATIVAVAIVVGIGLLLSRPAERGEGPPRIAVVLPSDRNPFWIDVRRGAEEAAGVLGDEVDVLVTASNDQDATSQNTILENLFARQQVDALVFGPANDHTTVPKIAKFLRAQIPVIVIDTELSGAALEEQGVQPTAFLGSSNVDGGEKAALEMVRAIEERGLPRQALLIQGSFVHQSAIDRTAGFLKVAGELGLEVDEVKGEWRRDRAQELAASRFSRARLGGIFANNDDMALGAIAGLKGLGITAEEWPVVIGFDGTEGAVQAINEGDMHATVKQDARTMGAEGVRRAVRALNNDETLPAHELLEVGVYPQR